MIRRQGPKIQFDQAILGDIDFGRFQSVISDIRWLSDKDLFSTLFPDADLPVDDVDSYELDELAWREFENT